MKYVGSKNRHAKEIWEAISKEVGSILSSKYENYVEPFVGGANMIDKVPKLLFAGVYGADVNEHLIELLKAVQEGWLPPETMTEEEYQGLKRDSKLPMPKNHMAMIAFAGIGCSYSGKWFGGYARGNDANGVPRNYAKESRDNLLKQASNLKGITFIHSSYEALTLPINGASIIYCDPPYMNTTRYAEKIEHDRFWQWCDMQIERGHKVFVSEYNAPEGWRCIWSKEVNNSLTKDTGCKQGVEKLFTK